MSYILYDSTIPVFQGILGSLSHILRKAERSRDNGGNLLEARLCEDMYPLTDQVRLAAQSAENVAARLTGREPITLDRNITTFAKCYELIETALKVLGEADKTIVNEHGDKLKATQLTPQTTVDMTGAAYAHTIALPNIFFHVTTAYAILRKEGVPLGKKDYYVGYFPEAAAATVVQ